MGGNALVSELRKNSQSINSVEEIGFSKRLVSRLARSAIVILGSITMAACSAGSNSSSQVQASYALGSQSASLESSHPLYRQNSHRSSIRASEKPSIFKRRSNRIPPGGGVRKTGNPYKILGRWYTPRHQPNYNKTGIASWYGTKFHGKKTANGEIFDMNNLTAAHPTLPIPSYIRVTNLSNGRNLILRLNDRGPYAHDRILDLSRKAAEMLGTRQAGTQRVRVQYLGPAPLDGNLAREQAHLARQPWFDSKYSRKPAKKSWFSPFGLGGPTR